MTAFRGMTMDETGYCYTQISAAVSFLEKFEETKLGMGKEEFYAKVKQQAEKHGIRFDPANFILNYTKEF